MIVKAKNFKVELKVLWQWWFLAHFGGRSWLSIENKSEIWSNQDKFTELNEEVQLIKWV